MNSMQLPIARCSLAIAAWMLWAAAQLAGAPTPVYRPRPQAPNAAPRFVGQHVVKWKAESEGKDIQCGWFGEFTPDGHIVTPENPCGMGQATWKISPEDRIFVIEWPLVKQKIFVHLGTGDGHQIDTKDNGIVTTVSKFSLERYVPTK